MEQQPMKLARATTLAQQFIELVADTCDRIQIAGSIRRKRDEVKDAEVVVIPQTAGGINRLWNRLEGFLLEQPKVFQKALYTNGNKKPTTRWGPYYRGIMYKDLRVEVFTANPDNWGYILVLRTGPNSDKNPANRYLMGRLYGSPFKATESYIHEVKSGKKIRVPDERTFYVELLGFPRVPAPEKRNVNIYTWLFEDNRATHWRGWGRPGDYELIEEPVVAQATLF